MLKKSCLKKKEKENTSMKSFYVFEKKKGLLKILAILISTMLVDK